MRTTRKKKAMKKYISNKRKIMMLTENYKQDKMITTMRKGKRMTMTMILMTTLLMTTPGTHYLIIHIMI